MSGADTHARQDAEVMALERPDKNLLVLYVLQSLAALFLAPIVFLPLYFKYHTLRYRIDAEGLSVAWGILFKREIHLTYKRIQDIHVHRNLIERWLGIGTVEIQTASGSAEAEMSLVGIRQHEDVRDFLYRRMRGLEAGEEGGDERAEAGGVAASAGSEAELVALLGQVRDELAATRAALEARS